MGYYPYNYGDFYSRQAPPCPGGQIYTIKAGDTLAKLAQGFRVSVDKILAANPGLNPNNLQIGQQICIPAQPDLICPGGQIYTIRPGDNFYAIAARFNVSLEALIRANPQISNPDVLQVGQNICIPAPGPQPQPDRYGCVTLRGTQIAPNAGGVAHIDLNQNAVMVAAANLPPLSEVGGDRYVAFIRQEGMSNYARVDLLRTEQNIWVGRDRLARPLNLSGRITVSTESGPGLAQPSGTVVLEGRLDNICTR